MHRPIHSHSEARLLLTEICRHDKKQYHMIFMSKPGRGFLHCYGMTADVPRRRRVHLHSLEDWEISQRPVSSGGTLRCDTTHTKPGTLQTPEG